MTKPFAHRCSRWREPKSQGFTLVEILVAVAALTVISTMVVKSTGQSLRREVLNSLTVDLYGWLEGVQRKAMSVDPSQRAANPAAFPPCTVTFNTGTLTPGSVLAQTPAECAPGSQQRDGVAEFLLPNFNSKANFVVQTFNGNSVTFSPRGTVTFTDGASTNPLTGPFTIEISREGGSLARCLRMEPLLGFMAIGSLNNQNPSASQDCPENSFDGVF
jgi:prepilin-type N-terminal cleavage/methylation domain-containing protein